MTKRIMRQPVRNIEEAIKLYYSKGYLNNDDIQSIFGNIGRTTIYRMKKYVMEVEKERNTPIVVPYHVNAKIAFEVWGIDINELERNLKKLISVERLLAK